MLPFYWMSRIKIEEYIIRVPRLAKDVIRFSDSLLSIESLFLFRMTDPATLQLCPMICTRSPGNVAHARIV
jgi:hypothetical protein